MTKKKTITFGEGMGTPLYEVMKIKRKPSVGASSVSIFPFI